MVCGAGNRHEGRNGKGSGRGGSYRGVITTWICFFFFFFSFFLFFFFSFFLYFLFFPQVFHDLDVSYRYQFWARRSNRCGGGPAEDKITPYQIPWRTGLVARSVVAWRRFLSDHLIRLAAPTALTTPGSGRVGQAGGPHINPPRAPSLE